MLKNVLITASNGDLAEAVTEVIRDSFSEINIFGCESGSLWPAKVIIKDVFKVPRGDALDYIFEINKLVKKYKIDLIIPCSDKELLSFSLAKVKKEISCQLLIPNCELVNIFSPIFRVPDCTNRVATGPLFLSNFASITTPLA